MQHFVEDYDDLVIKPGDGTVNDVEPDSAEAKVVEAPKKASPKKSTAKVTTK